MGRDETLNKRRDKIVTVDPADFADLEEIKAAARRYEADGYEVRVK